MQEERARPREEAELRQSRSEGGVGWTAWHWHCSCYTELANKELLFLQPVEELDVIFTGEL